MEFEGWPKIPRLNGDMVITEKLDGTNAGIIIEPCTLDPADIAQGNWRLAPGAFNLIQLAAEFFWVGAQSRNRLITPLSDNAGFAAWVDDHAHALVKTLGPGRHFGEWWGKGIQRGYDMPGKRFSLFNVDRWQDVDLSAVFGLGVVPVLVRHTFNTTVIKAMVDDLRSAGSVAAPGFMRAEGVVVWHSRARQLFKVLVENDDTPKSLPLGSAGALTLKGMMA